MCSSAKRFYGPAVADISGLDILTVPTGKKYVVKYIHVENPTGTPYGITLAIGSNVAANRLYDNTPVPLNGALSLRVYLPLEDGETLFASGNAALVITVGGDEVSL